MSSLPFHRLENSSVSNLSNSVRARFSRKHVALVLLALQTASGSLLIRYSRTRPGLAYVPSVAVFMAEIMKLVVSFTMCTLAQQNTEGLNIARTALKTIEDLFTRQTSEIIKLTVPAALYALQNTLAYVALSNLDAVIFEMTAQLRILTTALFAVFIFNRRLTTKQWTSLFILTVGVVIVQIQDATPSTTSSVDDHEVHQNRRIGLIAILASCVSSGLANGWLEWIFKTPSTSAANEGISHGDSNPNFAHLRSKSFSLSESPTSKLIPLPPITVSPVLPSIWNRNLQLSLPSLFFALIGILLPSSLSLLRDPVHGGIFQGFDYIVWLVVINQAMGGFLVTMAIQETSAVAKGFATAMAIIISTIASALFFGLLPGFMFLVGAALVIFSTVLYAMD